MEPMPLLRSYRDDLPEPDDAALRRARTRLEQRMAAAAAAPRRPLVRPRVLLGGLGAVAASGLVVAMVTAGPAPQASAEAVRLLDTAAAGARAQTGSGAYRTVVVRSEGLGEQLAEGGGGDVVAAYNTRTVRTTRVPAGAGTWTRTSWSLPPDRFYGGAAARALAEREGALGEPAYTEARPRIERTGTGDFTNGELGGGTSFGDDPAAIRALPHDPAALVAALRAADLGAGEQGQAAHVLEAASAVLSSGAADADLQAAVFQALRLQRGLAVVDDSATVDGRSGVAIGEEVPSWRYDAQQLLLDPATGEYLGDRDIALLPQGVIPAGTVLSSSTVLRD